MMESFGAWWAALSVGEQQTLVLILILQGFPIGAGIGLAANWLKRQREKRAELRRKERESVAF